MGLPLRKFDFSYFLLRVFQVREHLEKLKTN